MITVTAWRGSQSRVIYIFFQMLTLADLMSHHSF